MATSGRVNIGDFLGQQAVSKSIGQLERELGVALLERTTHDVRLTQAGTELLGMGREALRATDTAFEHARLVGHGQAGAIQIGVSPAIGPTERAQVVRALRDDAGDLEICLRDLRPEQAVQALRNRELEFVSLVTHPSPTSFKAPRFPRPEPPLRAHEPSRCRSRRAYPTRQPRRRTSPRMEPAGTPLTDLIISRLVAAGASVEMVFTRVWGMAAALADLVDLAAAAVLPPRWPQHERVVELPLADDLELPLTLLWPAGTRSVPVERIRAAMA